MAKRQRQEWGKIVLHHERLEQPTRWRKPRRVGVCFMGDLFHELVPLLFIDSVWGMMAEARHHTFYVLTKRPMRMRDYIRGRTRKGWLRAWSNIWLGVSVENQQTADERIPILLDIPAAHIWVSVEPMLGPVDLVRACGGPRHGFRWLVCGGESGPGARPMDIEWVRGLRDQCVGANVPFFFKQWGGVQKKRAGRVLDGITWDQRPQ